MTRRPPERAPCLARQRQVTKRARQCVGPGKPGSQLPVRMGDRRVGTWMPCEEYPIRSITTAHQELTRTQHRRLGLSLRSFVRLSGGVGKTQRTKNFCGLDSVQRMGGLSTPAERLGVLSTDFAGSGTAGPRTQTPDMDPRTRSDPTIVGQRRPTRNCSTTPCRWWRPRPRGRGGQRPGSLRSRWPAASMVLIGVDQAAAGRRAQARAGGLRSTCSPRPEPRLRRTSGPCRWGRGRRAAGQRPLAVRGDCRAGLGVRRVRGR